MSLKPCPFCKGEAEIERKGTARQSMIIACTDCGARVESGDVFGMTRDDRLAWNLRSAEPAQPVAWIEHHKGGDNLVWEQTQERCSPLYASPQMPPMTDEEILKKWDAIYGRFEETSQQDLLDFARSVRGER